MTAVTTRSEQDLRAGYSVMLRIREFEQTAIRALSEKHIGGAVHPYIGEEAIATGMCLHLRSDDIVLSTHRGHGHSIAKGAKPDAMLAELFGRATGLNSGKGGSMHVADFAVGMLGANGVVAANIVIAAGAAHEIKRRGEDRVVICFFGDGAANRGPFLEGLNWAQSFGLPLIFVCEDNQFSATTRTSAQTAGPGPAARARSLGIETVEVDGNDLSAVLDVASDTVARARSGRGPVFVHAKTFRLTGHTAVDAAPYRDSTEVDTWWLRDPIAACRQTLLESGAATEADLDAEIAAAAAELRAAYEAALAAPYPDPRDAFTDVQDIGSPSQEAF